MLIMKKINVMLLPEDTGKIRRFRVPLLIPVSAIACCVFFLSLFFWICKDYWLMKAQVSSFVQLERENILYQEEITHLSERITEIGKDLEALYEYDSKIKVMVNMEKQTGGSQFQGIGGSEPVSPIDSVHENVVRSMHQSLDNIDNDISLVKQSKNELLKFLESQQSQLARTPSVWPVRGWLSSRFGKRVSPFTGKKEFHRGIDIATRMGAKIIAPADGLVSRIVRDRGYGLIMTIKHGNGIVTRYAHLKKTLAKKGQSVKRGDVIALVGNSGRSTGPHLHYEVHLNRMAMNPMRYILE
jgi:murein DD-endopeptidase MepM/ murein hydrolase activator NlpD